MIGLTAAVHDTMETDMTKLTLGICILLMSAASAAFAGGFDITYGEGCWLETPSTVKTFACDTNTGAMIFTISCNTSLPVADFVGFTAIVDSRTDWWYGPPLSDWWQLYNTGSCRATSLSVSNDFTLSPQTACTDPFSGRMAIASVSAYETALYPPPYPLNAPPTYCARLKLAATTGDGGIIPFEADTWYYVARVRVNYAKTVGTGACAGCETPMALIVTQVSACGVGGCVRMSSAVHNGALGWQGDATPALNRTWGQVKSLYR